MLQDNYTTLKDIKQTENIQPFSSVLSHNSGIYPAVPGESININDAEGVGYAPIVRQVPQISNLQPVPTERERQKIVKKNYPLIIPAVGEKCDESQNVVLGAYRCNDCHKVEVKVAHCEEWECRVCGSRKVRRQSKDIVRRMYAFKKVLGTSANPRHIVISSLKWADMDLTQITTSINHLFERYLKDISGVYVIHPFRIRGWDNIQSAGSKARFWSDANIKRRLREYRGDKAVEVNSDKPIDENISSGGFWEMVKDDVLELGDWRKYCYVSPHVHIIGWGKMPKADEFHARTHGAYIYKMIDTKGIGRSFEFTQNSNNFDFSSEILRTLNYLGSHAAIRSNDDLIEVKGQGKRKHANRIFRPFGLCSTKAFVLDSIDGQKFVMDGDIVRYDIVCPECSSKNLDETFRFNKTHFIEADKDKPFDEDYNPLDFEGDVITDLIAPLRYWEWKWYKYRFNHVYAGEVERFAESLPKPKPYTKRETKNKGGLLNRIAIILEPLDRLALNNTADGVSVE